MLLQHADHHRRDRLIELEHDVPDEAVADDDVDRPAVAAARWQIAPFNVPLEVDAGVSQQLVRLLHHGVSLFRFLADAQQPHDRVVAAEHVLGIHGAQAGELDQLLRRAIDVRARVEYDDGLSGRWEQRGDGRPR